MKSAVAMLMAVLLGTAAVAAADGSRNAGVRVTDAWISAPPPAAGNGAAYLSLKNGPREDSLMAVQTSVAEAAEMHEMNMANGLMHMRQLKSLHLAPGQEVQFAPGGRHIMLVGLKRPLKVGERIPLTLRFRRAGTLVVQAEVREPGLDEDAPHGMH